MKDWKAVISIRFVLHSVRLLMIFKQLPIQQRKAMQVISSFEFLSPTSFLRLSVPNHTKPLILISSATKKKKEKFELHQINRDHHTYNTT